METNPPQAEPEEPEEPATDAPGEEKRSRRRRVPKVVVRLGAVLLAVLIALILTVLTIDLGPALRTRAELEGSKYLKRPLHIGRISARLVPGTFVFDDLMIEGLTPADRPFLTAKRVTVRIPWWTIVTRKLIVESVDMTDWHMIVETFPNGRPSNFPKIMPERKGPQGPSRFTTTVRAVHAARGQFTYQDHGTPWSTIGRNLDVTLYRSDVNNDYRGNASFSNGTISIQSYQPFSASMRSRFKLVGGKVAFDRIDLTSEGATSVLDGVVDLGRWPEQIYRIKSHIDFPTQKGIFFHRDGFSAYGQGDFQGTFHLFKGGRELKGTFTSPMAGVNDWRFPNLRGTVLWLPDRLEITDSTSELYGGTARFDYRMAPIGRKGVPTMATWDVQYRDVDLSRLTDFLETRGLRLAGRATGTNRLAWPLGGWAVKRGEGVVDITPPPGVETMTRAMPAARLQDELTAGPEAGPFNTQLPLGYVPVAGRLAYKLDPEWITLAPSWVATPKSYVEFQGETAYGQRSRIPFHVTSLDWQESDRVLAGIMTTFGASTGAIPIGGSGEFDGVMLESFSRPRIAGKFSGDGMRAWNVVWGKGTADVVIENSYANVKNAVISAGASEITAEGLFSLGYPRKDGGEQINARVRLTRRPMADLKRAFELDDYDMDGLVSGEYHVYGDYETPLGFGRLLVQDGVAYGETFESMSSALRFEGTGVRLDTIQIAKATGEVTGAAWVGWDGTYSFNVDGRRIPVESLKVAAFPSAPLSGLLHFNATGAGNFDEPRYDVKARVDDLFVGEEGVGQLTGRLALRGELLTADYEAASPRLSVSGSGRLELTDRLNAEMAMRFQDTSLDPYLRFFEPRLSPFTTAVASGTVRVLGELSDIDRLQVSTRVEQLNLKLFDYALANDGPIELSLNNHVLEIGRLRVAGEGTRLQMGGTVQLHDSTVAVEATGEANLGILQGFFRNLRSRGTAALLAEVKGPLANPQFSGSARLSDGRIRHLSAPHGLEAIDGIISFDGTGIRLEDLTARVAGGQVVFGGRVGLEGFVPRQLNLTAVGERMRLRYPEGLPSNVDADLWLRGDVSAPVLGGSVVVHDAVWRRRFEVDPNIFDLASGATVLPSGPVGASGLPLRFDIQVTANNTLRVQNNLADIVASADLRLQGTYDRPAIFGRAEVDRGNILFEGNRYVVTRGTIDFLTPPAGNIEPLFDIEAETRVRAASQSDRSEVFRVTLGVTGTPRSFSLSLGSDPPLPEVDILGLLFGAPTDVSNAELRALSASGAEAAEQALLKAAGARLLAGSISAPVRRVVEETLKLDTAQIAPTIGSDNDPLSTSIRLILGKRLSPRAYLTFSRPLGGATRDQIIVLEYDQTDRLGYVLTQTGDRTFAVDFRVRRSF